MSRDAAFIWRRNKIPSLFLHLKRFYHATFAYRPILHRLSCNIFSHSFYEWILRMFSLRNVSRLKNTNTKLLVACWHIRCPVLTSCGQFHSKLVTWQQLSWDSTGICNFERNERICEIKNLFKIKLMPLWWAINKKQPKLIIIIFISFNEHFLASWLNTDLHQIKLCIETKIFIGFLQICIFCQIKRTSPLSLQKAKTMSP